MFGVKGLHMISTALSKISHLGPLLQCIEPFLLPLHTVSPSDFSTINTIGYIENVY